MRVVFEEIKIIGQRYDWVDGKRRRRQRKFWATVNPYNRDPETGAPRTAREVYTELRVEVAAWEAMAIKESDNA